MYFCYDSLQVIYDGTGTVIKWIMVTDGSELGDNIALTGEHDILFLKSETGSLNSTVVKSAICLKRYRYLVLYQFKYK